MLWYLLISTSIYGCLFIAWRSHNWPNILIKTVMFFMTIASLIFAGIQAGFVVAP